jgi:hypothetical protein
MKQNLTVEEQKVIYNAVRYYQMHRTALNGNEYQICDSILTDLFDNVYTQQKEQPNND